jgi:hypothetical protein
VCVGVGVFFFKTSFFSTFASRILIILHKNNHNERLEIIKLVLRPR